MYIQVLKKETYELLKEIMADIVFKDYFLVGGTALALQIGHRQSIDLDLFTRKNIDTERLRNHLKEKYGFKVDYETKNTLKGFIKKTMIDCIKYDYEMIRPLTNEEGIRILSKEDIIPMKIQAIVSNGTRIKDFIDIAYLSEYYSLNEMIKYYKKKYKIDNEIVILKALIYFDDIDYKDLSEKIYSRMKFLKYTNRISNAVEKAESQLFEETSEAEE